MTNAELIAMLQKFPPDAKVFASVRSYTKRYGENARAMEPQCNGHDVILNVSFPEGVVISHRNVTP